MKPPAALPIGIFDSGVGGLTVVRQIHRLLPAEDLVYLGDTARVPYGTKSPGTVIRFAREDMGFLLEQKVKAVVVACNTVSAWALPLLQQEFDLPIWGVILPGAQSALKRTKNRCVGVIATSATIQSQAYDRLLTELNPAVRVFAKACPLLVPLVEEGWLNHPITIQVLREYLDPLLRCGIDTLVLGCTHYPLLKRALRTACHSRIRLVDSAESCARFVQARLADLALLRPPGGRPGRIQPYVTDETARFDQLSHRFLGCATEPAVKVELPQSAQ